MARKGTRAERLIALSVGFIAYGVTYLLAYAGFDGDTLPMALLDLLWVGSIAVGVLSAWAMALLILKHRP